MNNLDPVNISIGGIHLIEANAGTGKTYSITGLYVRLLLEKELRPEQILVVTYTEAACQELRDAIRSRLADAYELFNSASQQIEDHSVKDLFLSDLLAKYVEQGNNIQRMTSILRLAITEFDLSAIYTIHGFCMRVLQDFAFESGFPFETNFIENDGDLLQQVLDDYWAEHSNYWQPVFSSFLCHHKISPDSIRPTIEKLLKTAMVAGVDAIHFSNLKEPGTLTADTLSQLAYIWREHRQALMQELSASNALKRAEKTYRQDNLDRWFAECDGYFFSGSSIIPPIEAIIKLSSDALRAGAKKGKSEEVPHHEFFDLCRQMSDELSAAKNGLVSQLLVHCHQSLEKLKRENGLISFDDLLTGVRDALRRPLTGKRFAGKIAGQYPVALIDEFQDTDPVQYEIFKTVFQSGKADGLFLVGDPKQAIYGFRGADIFAYLSAAKTSVDDIHSLTVNWRSEPGLIAACNCLFNKRKIPPFILEEINFCKARAPEKIKSTLVLDSELSAPMTFAVFDDQPDKTVAQTHIAHWLACQITALLAPSSEKPPEFIEQHAGLSTVRKKLSARDIAILVRTHKEGECIKLILAEHGINAVIQAKNSVFQSLEAREIELVLEAVFEPFNEKRLRAALTTRLFGVNAKGLSDLENGEVWEGWLLNFSEYNLTWNERGVAPMLYELLNRENVFTRISRVAGGERALTNIRHLIELLQQAAHENGLKPEMLIKWMKDSRHQTEQGDANQVRLESDENLVQIVTVHKSKGLQYPIVFCPFLWDSRLSFSKRPEYVTYHDEQGKLSIDFDSEDKERNYLIQKKEDLAEELRLLYVALTRAQNKCIINWGKVYSKKTPRTATSALQYLLNGISGKAENDDDIIGDMRVYFEQVFEENWSDCLRELTRQSDGNIQMVSMHEDTVSKTVGLNPSLPLGPVQELRKVIVKHRAIHSFSSLHSKTSMQAAENPDYDSLPSESPSEIDYGVNAPKDIFSFPRGAKAGTCLHSIFEEFDFQETETEIIQELVEHKLLYYGFEEEWGGVVTKFLREMVQVDLCAGSERLALGQIPKGNRLDEMEFYYTVPSLADKELSTLLHNHHTRTAKQGSCPNLDSYLKGFIDLIFQYGNKFYIVDYKSNYLGNDYADYSPEKLKNAMIEAGYDLQYRIYTIALHRYLSQRLSGYDYETHFGGVYYLFLRGLSLQNGHESGVFFDRPGWRDIETVNNQLKDSL